MGPRWRIGWHEHCNNNEQPHTHLCKINGLQCKFTEPLPTIDIRLRGSRNTSSTELGSDTVLQQRREFSCKDISRVRQAYLVI